MNLRDVIAKKLTDMSTAEAYGGIAGQRPADWDWQNWRRSTNVEDKRLDPRVRLLNPYATSYDPQATAPLPYPMKDRSTLADWVKEMEDKENAR